MRKFRRRRGYGGTEKWSCFLCLTFFHQKKVRYMAFFCFTFLSPGKKSKFLKVTDAALRRRALQVRKRRRFLPDVLFSLQQEVQDFQKAELLQVP